MTSGKADRKEKRVGVFSAGLFWNRRARGAHGALPPPKGGGDIRPSGALARGILSLRIRPVDDGASAAHGLQPFAELLRDGAGLEPVPARFGLDEDDDRGSRSGIRRRAEHVA